MHAVADQQTSELELPHMSRVGIGNTLLCGRVKQDTHTCTRVQHPHSPAPPPECPLIAPPPLAARHTYLLRCLRGRQVSQVGPLALGLGPRGPAARALVRHPRRLGRLLCRRLLRCNALGSLLQGRAGRGGQGAGGCFPVVRKGGRSSDWAEKLRYDHSYVPAMRQEGERSYWERLLADPAGWLAGWLACLPVLLAWLPASPASPCSSCSRSPPCTSPAGPHKSVVQRA